MQPRPPPACPVGEGDGELSADRLQLRLNPIRLARMVKEILRLRPQRHLIHHPDELDGVLVRLDCGAFWLAIVRSIRASRMGASWALLIGG